MPRPRAESPFRRPRCRHTRLRVRYLQRSYRPHRNHHIDVAAQYARFTRYGAFVSHGFFSRTSRPGHWAIPMCIYIYRQHLPTRLVLPQTSYNDSPASVSPVTILSSLIMQTSGGRAHTDAKEQMNTHDAMPYQLPSLHWTPRQPCSRSAICDAKRGAPATKPKEEAIPSRIHAHLKTMRW